MSITARYPPWSQTQIILGSETYPTQDPRRFTWIPIHSQQKHHIFKGKTSIFHRFNHHFPPIPRVFTCDSPALGRLRPGRPFASRLQPWPKSYSWTSGRGGFQRLYHQKWWKLVGKWWLFRCFSALKWWKVVVWKRWKVMVLWCFQQPK